MDGVESFVEKCRDLLELEREEEIKQSTWDWINFPNRRKLFVVIIIYREALRGQTTKRLAQRGLCLTRLRFQYTYTGLYGRTILVFEGESLSRAQTFGPGFVSIKYFHWNFLSFFNYSGDIAAIYQQGHSIDDQPSLAHGLIFRLTANTIHITIEDNDDEQFNSLGDTCHFMIIKMANDVTYRRLKQYVE
jgi:hypothetical protein